MNTSTDQKDVNQKIHDFMARKSAWKTFSKTVADHVTPKSWSARTDVSDVSYEQLEWHHTNFRSRIGMQKAH